MRFIKILLVSSILLVVAYLVGPKPKKPVYDATLPTAPSSVSGLESYIDQQEAKHKLRPNNQARIVWYNDSVKQPTDYAIVYLHGFSASQEEGNPAHRAIAKKFGCNLYLARLSQHGIDTSEQLLNLTADNYWQSAKEALVIGKQLGKKVILMGTSTGGTQALQLAAAYPNDIAGLILYSPNIAINDPNAWLLNNPWGLQIARMVKGSNYNDPADDRPIYKQYWNKHYRLEAVVALQELVETTMNEKTFATIHQPTLALYYYKDELHQDPVVKVSATQKMMEQLGTPSSLKKQVAMPKTEDHVIGSTIKSKDVEGVIKETKIFLKEVMKLTPKE